MIFDIIKQPHFTQRNENNTSNNIALSSLLIVFTWQKQKEENDDQTNPEQVTVRRESVAVLSNQINSDVTKA